MNPIDKNLRTGTLGEFLVQARLLQHDVQAAPPIKDSGNDLIAVRGEVFRAIQVKIMTADRFDLSDLRNRRHHIAALVELVGERREVYFDRCRIFLMEHRDVKQATYDPDTLEAFVLSPSRIEHLFSTPPNPALEPTART